MSETEFLSISDDIFRRIENALDDAGLDVD